MREYYFSLFAGWLYLVLGSLFIACLVTHSFVILLMDVEHIMSLWWFYKYVYIRYG